MKYEYQLTLRLPEHIAETIRIRSKKAKRSMNAEILHILSQSIDLESNIDATQKLKSIIATAELLINELK